MDKFYQKVKEGGYDFERLGNPKSVKERDNALLLDPLAWQALGKAEGWKGRYNWMHYAHRCFRHLMTGKDIDSFFTNLFESNGTE